MNLFMSSGEYQALMREIASKPSDSSFSFSGRNDGNNNNNNNNSKAKNSATDHADVMLGEITLRFDAKWERFAANVAVQLLELGKEVVQSIKIVSYAVSACLFLYGASCVIRALRDVDSKTSTHKDTEDK